MPKWFDEFVFGATLPFRAATEAVLFVPTLAVTTVAETIHKVVDSDHDFDPFRDYEEARGIVGKTAGIGLAVGGILATGGAGLAVAGAAACNGASNINQKAEKLVTKKCSSTEKDMLHIGMAVDACGVVGNAAKLGMDGLGCSPEFLGPLKTVSSCVGLPLGLVMRITPEAQKKLSKMSPAEQALEAAAMGISLYKLQQLLEELANVYN